MSLRVGQISKKCLNEQIDKKRSTVCTNSYSDCLLKTRPPNISNMSILVMSVSKNFCGRISGIFFKTDLWLSRNPPFVSVIGVYVGLPSELSITNSFIKQSMKEEFEDTKGAIRIRISKKNRQYNGQKKKQKRTNNDLQNIHIKLKIE